MLEMFSTFSILYTPVIIQAVDEFEGSLEILDIDPLVISLVGFVGFIEYAFCIGVAASIIMREETITMLANAEFDIFCLNKVSLYIKKKLKVYYITIIRE